MFYKIKEFDKKTPSEIYVEEQLLKCGQTDIYDGAMVPSLAVFEVVKAILLPVFTGFITFLVANQICSQKG